MGITVGQLVAANSDETLMALLTTELNERATALKTTRRIDDLVAWLKTLPRGLRAMAATHKLSVSLTLDDLGWHFANWHSKELYEETEDGLRELGAAEAAKILKRAYEITLPYWDEIGTLLAQDFSTFVEWYHTSPLQPALSSLNDAMWALQDARGRYGLMAYWLDYARHSPEKIVETLAAPH